MIRVSAVVPNHNHGHLLAEAVGSLLAQTRPFDEIIVVDDGSTDDSVAVVHALQRQAPGLRLLRHETRRGVVAALNTGLAGARGEFVHFGAADDRFRPGLVAETLALLTLHPAAAFACGEALLVDRADGRPRGQRPPARPSSAARAFTPAETQRLLRRMDHFALTASALVRRRAVLDAGGFDPALGPFADGILLRRLALTQGFCFTPATLAEWWVDDAGYSRRHARDAEFALGALSDMPARLAADPAFPAWYPALFARRWRFAAARLAVLATPPDRAMLAALLPAAAPVLAALRPAPAGLQRLLLLGALTLWLRPISLAGLAATAWRRWRAASRAREGIAQRRYAMPGASDPRRVRRD